MSNCRFFAVFLPVLLAACTQTPAPVALKGGEDFGPRTAMLHHHRPNPPVVVAAAPARVSTPEPLYVPRPLASNVDMSTAGTVQLQSVSSTDLMPPSTLAPKPAKETISGAGLMWPVQGKVVEKFGKNYDGVSIQAGAGTPVRAAEAGEVVFAGNQLRGYGTTVIVKNADGRHSTYAQMVRPRVQEYDRVARGDVLGYVASAPKGSKPTLYFSLRDKGKFIDPLAQLPTDVASAQ